MNPFKYKNPLAPTEDQADRPEVETLLGHLREGDHVLVAAPRKLGKTTLVRRVCALREAEGDVALFISVQGCRDFQQWSGHLRFAYADLERRSQLDGHQALRHAYDDLARRDPASVSTGDWLRLADHAPPQRVVMAIDEFQHAIARDDPGLEEFRTILQAQSRI